MNSSIDEMHSRDACEWIGVECPDCFVDFHHYPMVVPRRVARQAQSEKMRRGKPTMRSGETSLRIDTVRR
eukprot:scaffold390776_cov79-Cyclotella_meneghiniana.AAC.2